MKNILYITAVLLVLLAGAFFLPWKNINWGNIRFLNQETVTVTGEAQSQQKTQMATFSAGVSSINDDKQKAVEEVNSKSESIITAVKDFGVTSKDIKTQNLSVYQQDETYYDNGTQKQRPGQWRVNNTIEITLRDVERASALSDLLAKSGATNVYGPNFTMDNSQHPENSLLDLAMKNAKEKAEVLAQSSGKKLGKVISVMEGYTGSPVYPLKGFGGGGGAAVEPGSQSVSKTVTVTYELE